ncbi:hypothetical protein AGMMS49938_10690 [Fibrobacterales bacterium]|nr:hypothetical protein AGMMS49938_10690 [Fibrobacterales bacterium]
MIPFIYIIAVLSFFLSAVFFLLKKQVPLFFCIIVGSGNILMLAGKPIILGNLLLFSVLFFSVLFSKKKNFLFWYSLVASLLYFTFIFIAKPYTFNAFYFINYMNALLLFCFTMLSKWNSKTVISFLTIYGLFMIFIGIFEKILFGSERISGIHQGALSYIFVVIAVWSLWFIEGALSKRHSKPVLLISVFLVFIIIALSATRIALIGFALTLFLTLFVIFLMRTKQNAIIKRVMIGIGIVAVFCTSCVLFYIILPDDFSLKMRFNILLSGKIDDSNMGRIYVWLCAIDNFVNHKIFGIGPGNFAKVYVTFFQEHIGTKIIVSDKFWNAHNIFLVVLNEHGISGTVILLSIVLPSIFQVVKFLKKHPYHPLCTAILCTLFMLLILELFAANFIYQLTITFSAWFFGLMASFGFKEAEYDS